MFTGIITDIGKIKALTPNGDLRVRIETLYQMDKVALGASISCDGVCLTVVDKQTGWFDVDVSAESLNLTTIGQAANPWAVDRLINLERALRIGDELGGHIVSGHVDGVARVVSTKDDGDSTRFEFEAPEHLAKFIAPKGSVSLNGTSLTVNDVNGVRFGVNIIPHTKAETTWHAVQAGDVVNLEIDTMARYVARLQEFTS